MNQELLNDKKGEWLKSSRITKRKHLFTALDSRHKHHLRSCLVESLTESSTLTVGHTSHVYAIGHSHILRTHTAQEQLMSGCPQVGRQCESTQLLFFMAASAKRYIHTQTHTSQDCMCIYGCPEWQLLRLLLVPAWLYSFPLFLYRCLPLSLFSLCLTLSP